ncbi:MAG: peptidoglycan-binding protein [Candidatus Thiodiazotropha taylori]|nr:peptidoglycan-binding protein [Candidatus Thiodiazotropha endolucinida]MCW4230500.1 peptidoglycan-binding protein [Candidatus Thiodiazotropha taylori]
MGYPVLKRGDFGDGVERLQSQLNKSGTMLAIDGEFGPSTEKGVIYAQDIAQEPQTGIARPSLWRWLRELSDPFDKLHTDGIAFIAKEETGGLAYYEIVTQWPHYPGYQSGITIGAGYDLRFNTESDFIHVWGNLLPEIYLSELLKDIGKKGSKARAAELKRKGINIPFKNAWPAFTSHTLPRFYEQTALIYPSLDILPDFCRTALVSLVFNRGASLTGSRRREMKNIQKILSNVNEQNLYNVETKIVLQNVEDEILSMKRLWSSGSGLISRRQAEANLWRKGLNIVADDQ